MNTANDPLNEREFELINIVGGKLSASQRDLSRQMNMSLGMTNMLLRRLVTKGYIRITQLNQKKVQYILTPQGFAEKMRKSVKYTLKTLNSISLVKNKLLSLLKNSYDQGVRKFYILGSSDMGGLIDMVIREAQWKDVTIASIDHIEEALADGTLLICREQEFLGNKPLNYIYVLEELAKDKALIG